ncbi:hypothetical protein [Reichenbachiella versicolor]|uniref:hypothetical protein n=1 Tax=Reichenbachiella versicolor TaxID=1821036 RepID=UPI000D6DFA03|nr:hypothetical protein [Reichenbachiella versicolor]
MKFLPAFTLLVLVLTSCDNSRLNNDKLISPVFSNKFDTIRNNSVYRTKIFLSDNKLLKQARELGITNPVSVRFVTGMAEERLFAIPNQAAVVESDTAFVTFSIKIDTLGVGDIVEYYWQCHYAIDYDLSGSGVDTTFIVNKMLLVKG